MTIIEQIINWIKFDVLKKAPKDLKQQAKNAVDLVEKIKAVVENPALDILTALIPSTVDDKILAWGRLKLNEVLPWFNILKQCQCETIEAMLECFVTELRKLPDAERNMHYGQLATWILKVADGKEIAERLYRMMIEASYNGSKSE